MDTGRAVLLTYLSESGARRRASGLHIGDDLVLTANHCASGTGHEVHALASTCAATVVARGTDEIDLALLRAPGLIWRPNLPLARLDRSNAERVVCLALGFPTWKSDRRSVQLNGWIPTGEGLAVGAHREGDTERLTMKIDGQPIAYPAPSGGAGAPPNAWQGMSGGGVIHDGAVVGVVHAHYGTAGLGALEVTPLSALNSLPEDLRASWEVLRADERTDPAARTRDGLIERLRTASVAAAEEASPRVLPDADRLRDLESAVGVWSDVQFPLLILGEGGLGKSVLAGQVFTSLKQAPEALFGHDAPREVFLVPCSRIPAASALSSWREVDRALSAAAFDDPDPPVGLFDLLAEQPKGQRATLIIDTVDLILREDSADHVAHALRKIATHSDLVLTCREREWRNLLPGELDLSRTSWVLARLSPGQIMRWSKAYLEQADVKKPQRDAFLSSLAVVVNDSKNAHVFDAPLRLAMACQLYPTSGDGTIPTDLTAVALYDEYWNQRVARDRKGRATAASQRVQQAAQAVAREIWTRSTRHFVEHVPWSAAITWADREPLISEGILYETGGFVGFFHQTFAEYAVARFLAVAGDQEDFGRLNGGLITRTSGYWGIASQLVQLDLTPGQFRLAVEAMPLQVPEGARAVIKACVERGDLTLLRSSIAWLAEQDPEGLQLVSDLLVEAPREVLDEVANVLVPLVTSRTRLGPLMQNLGALIRRLDTGPATDLLLRAMDALSARTRPSQNDPVPAEAQRLAVSSIGQAPEHFDHIRLIEAFPRLPVTGQSEITAAIAATAPNPARDQSFLQIAIPLDVPSGAVDVYAEQMWRGWQDPATRAAFGWDTWLNLLEADYGRRWNACQVRVVRRICTDPAVARQLFEEAFTRLGYQHRDRLAKTVDFVAGDNPVLAAELIGAVAKNVTKQQLDSASKVLNAVVGDIDDERRRELYASYRPHVPAAPRALLPALAKLAASQPDLIADCIGELGAQRFRAELAPGVNSTAVRNGLTAFVNELDPDLIQLFAAQLVELLAGSSDRRDRETLGRLQGRLASVSSVARDAVQAMLEPSGDHAAGRAATNEMKSRPAEWRTGNSELSTVSWLCGLLKSEQGHSVGRVAELLGLLAENPGWDADLVKKVFDRARTAVQDGREDPQVAGRLLQAIRVLVHTPPTRTFVTSAQVDHLVQTYAESVQALLIERRSPDHAPALFTQLTMCAASPGGQVLAAAEQQAAIWRILASIDCGEVSSTAHRELASLLVAGSRRSAAEWPFESVWESLSDDNKDAVVEALERGDFPGGQDRALAFARRASCPQRVANRVLRAR